MVWSVVSIYSDTGPPLELIPGDEALDMLFSRGVLVGY